MVLHAAYRMGLLLFGMYVLSVMQ